MECSLAFKFTLSISYSTAKKKMQTVLKFSIDQRRVIVNLVHLFH